MMLRTQTAIQSRRERLAAVTLPRPQAPPKPNPDLEIANVQAYPVQEPVSRRSYTIVKMQTKSGLVGYGESAGTPNRELAQVLELLRGQEASSYETMRSWLSASPTTLAALNMAMLDLVGKFSNAPVYQVLGGPTRYKARALTLLEGSSDLELATEAQRAWEAGFRAFSVPVPPYSGRNQGQAFVQATRKRLDALRKTVGPGADFVLDGAGSLVPGDAASLAAALEMFYLLWLDEPCAVSNLAVVKKISAENVTPVGFGRGICQPGAFQDLLREDAIDILRPDISLNGISGIRKMAVMAETYYVAIAPYHIGGPVASAAALHLAASIPNFFIQQFPLPQAEQDRQMRAALTGRPVEVIRDGFAALPTGPGLGFALDEKALEQYKERGA